MKKIFPVFVMISSLFITSILNGQVTVQQSKEIGNIFLKGNYHYSLNQSVGYAGGSEKIDGTKSGNVNGYRANIKAEYFVADNWFVGGELRLRGSTEKDQLDNRESLRHNFVGLSGGWGKFLGNVPLKVTGKIGGGPIADIYENDIETVKDNGFQWRAAAEVGVPLNIYQDRIFITPAVGCMYKAENQDHYKESTSGIYALGTLDFYLGCGDHICDCERDGDFPERYAPGTLQLGGGLKSKLFVGSTRQTYKEDDYEDTYTDRVANFKFHGDGYIYPVKYVGVGAGIHFNTSSQKQKDSDYKTSSTGFTFMPMVVGHLPVEGVANQAFVDIGYGFGFENNTTAGTGFENKNKASTTEFYAGVGWDYFIQDNMSLTLNLGYGSATSKNKDNDVKTVRSGAVVGIAWNAFLKTW